MEGLLAAASHAEGKTFEIIIFLQSEKMAFTLDYHVVLKYNFHTENIYIRNTT